MDSLTKFDAARLRVYDVSSVCILSKRDRLVLDCIRRRSFDRQQTRAWIPSLGEIERETLLHPPDISRALKSLKSKLIIEENPPKWYGINVLFCNWRVPQLKVNEQLSFGLEQPEMDLPEALRQNFVELGGTESPKPARDAVMPQVACPGQTDRSPELGVESKGAAPTCPEPGSARRAGGESPRHSGSETVSESLMETAMPPKSVSNLLTTPKIPSTGAGKMGVVSELLRGQSGATQVSPRTSVVPIVPTEPTGTEVHQLYQPKGNSLVQGATVSKSLTRARKVRVTRVEEQRLWQVIKECVGEQDMKDSWYIWRMQVIRNYSWAVDEAVGQIRMLDRCNNYINPDDPKHKARLLMVHLKKMIGLRSWSEVQPGPDPL